MCDVDFSFYDVDDLAMMASDLFISINWKAHIKNGKEEDGVFHYHYTYIIIV